MKLPFSHFNKPPNPHESRLLRGFKAIEELDALLPIYRDISALGTAISLDREGVSDEQVASYYARKEEFFNQHGDQLLEYLAPYGELPTEQMQHRGGIDFERWFTFQGLLRYRDRKAKSEEK